MELLPLDIIKYIECYLFKKPHHNRKLTSLKLLIYRYKHFQQNAVGFRTLRLNAVNMSFDREYERVMLDYYDNLNLPDAQHMLKILKRCPCEFLFCQCRRTRTLIYNSIHN